MRTVVRNASDRRLLGPGSGLPFAQEGGLLRVTGWKAQNVEWPQHYPTGAEWAKMLAPSAGPDVWLRTFAERLKRCGVRSLSEKGHGLIVANFLLVKHASCQRLPLYREIYRWVLDSKRMFESTPDAPGIGYVQALPRLPTELPKAVYDAAYGEEAPEPRQVEGAEVMLKDHVPLRKTSRLLIEEAKRELQQQQQQMHMPEMQQPCFNGFFMEHMYKMHQQQLQQQQQPCPGLRIFGQPPQADQVPPAPLAALPQAPAPDPAVGAEPGAAPSATGRVLPQALPAPVPRLAIAAEAASATDKAAENAAALAKAASATDKAAENAAALARDFAPPPSRVDQATLAIADGGRTRTEAIEEAAYAALVERNNKRGGGRGAGRGGRGRGAGRGGRGKAAAEADAPKSGDGGEEDAADNGSEHDAGEPVCRKRPAARAGSVPTAKKAKGDSKKDVTGDSKKDAKGGKTAKGGNNKPFAFTIIWDDAKNSTQTRKSFTDLSYSRAKAYALKHGLDRDAVCDGVCARAGEMWDEHCSS